jgi:hypothetical protein
MLPFAVGRKNALANALQTRHMASSQASGGKAVAIMGRSTSIFMAFDSDSSKRFGCCAQARGVMRLAAWALQHRLDDDDLARAAPVGIMQQRRTSHRQAAPAARCAHPVLIQPNSFAFLPPTPNVFLTPEKSDE